MANNSVDEIEDGLYLGDYNAACDLRTLKDLHISHILTVADVPLETCTASLQGISTYFINVFDMADSDLLSYFQEALAFIEDGLRKGKVLVHCHWGVSRSATLVTAYVMKKYALTLEEALARVKSKRRVAFPNSGFMAQLLLYEKMGYQLDTSNLQYKLYLLKAAGALFAKGKRELDARYEVIVHPDLSAGSVAYKCKNCRSFLVGAEAVLPHQIGETPDWTDNKWSGTADKICDEGVFTFPIKWMSNQDKPIAGKLHCPKCDTKVGNYNWVAGYKCPCSAKITPGFYIIRSKVDKCI
ncbi:hypothetical protein Pmani_032662 [Petrolisthes manimaculis]|uniref:Protein-tyrosine-phosphatase n=1 Tax=Petrolisthes manimaculis TaxID=1843537 RepID=A0AAE1NT67_9EUCA|nr:hypothetical protein Pmani_032662 [Petrolisthes manimaculis]